MRIAFDCTHHQYPGGVRVYIERLLAGLARVAPRDELVLHYRGRRRPATLPATAGAGPVVFARGPRRLLSALENRLGWPAIEAWTGPVDVFHGPHFWLPVARHARLVLTVHDVAYLRHPEFYGHQRLNEYGYGYLLRHSLARADAVIAPCQHTRRDLLELFDLAPERIWVVPFGRDAGFTPVPVAEQRRVRAQLGLERPHVLYPVGTFEPRKNLPRVMEAFALAFPYRQERPLLFVTGVGQVPVEVIDAVRRLRLGEDVRIQQVGYPDELRALMSGALWGLYPSLYEGFGLPALEALGCGLPLLAGNVASVPEVVGDAALLVDPTDPEALAEGMRRLQDDSVLRETLGERGRQRAGDPAWSWERAARQTLAAYRDDRAAHTREPDPLATSAAHGSRASESPRTLDVDRPHPILLPSRG